MSFATPAERRQLLTLVHAPTLTVQVVTHDGRELELTAEDVDHALNLQSSWFNRHKAQSTEIFRILPDGTLNPTLGPRTRS